MGITSNCAKFLFYARKNGVSFDRSLMLGRQQLYVTPEEIDELRQLFGIQDSFKSTDGFAEPLFRTLGAEIIDSIDYSEFEKASIIHDLNTEIPDSSKNKYTLVFDGGTLEHIFNFPVAIKNCMDSLTLGGHFISIAPTNNQCGHGFYQFSPELFFSLLSSRHGFRVKFVYLGVDMPRVGIRDWYQIANPEDVKQRVTFSNDRPAYLMVLAEKISDFSGQLMPYQSDYKLVWDVHDSIQSNKPLSNETKYIHWYRRYVPTFLKNIVRHVLSKKGKRKNVSLLGNVNPQFFKKIDI